MRGYPPKSPDQALAEGDPRKIGKRKLAQRIKAMPKFESGLPECPAHLNATAREVWEMWAEQLAIAEHNKRPDWPALEAACQAYAKAVSAEAILEREGLIVKTDKGLRAHPAVAIANNAWSLVKSFCTEFGFTPVSRVRLSMGKPPVSNSADDLMKVLSKPYEKRQQEIVN